MKFAEHFPEGPYSDEPRMLEVDDRDMLENVATIAEVVANYGSSRFVEVYEASVPDAGETQHNKLLRAVVSHGYATEPISCALWATINNHRSAEHFFTTTHLISKDTSQLYPLTKEGVVGDITQFFTDYCGVPEMSSRELWAHTIKDAIIKGTASRVTVTRLSARILRSVIDDDAIEDEVRSSTSVGVELNLEETIKPEGVPPGNISAKYKFFEYSSKAIIANLCVRGDFSCMRPTQDSESMELVIADRNGALQDISVKTPGALGERTFLFPKRKLRHFAREIAVYRSIAEANDYAAWQAFNALK
jgi:hypothetical protein